jgi:putative ABC transport system permease protein
MFRRGKFTIAVVATGLAFGMSLVMQGMVAHLGWETSHIVGVFEADQWVVAEGGTGPFTTMTFIPADIAEVLEAQAGVTAADPFVQAREILAGLDTFVIGIRPGGLGDPGVDEGRRLEGSGEVLTASKLGFRPGDLIELAGHRATVVGTVADATYYFGQPAVFAPIEDVQRWYLNGGAVANGVAVSGRIDVLPPGTAVLSNQQTMADLDRPQASGRDSIVILNSLLWIMAAGIVGTLVYLIALERTRDVAVLKTMGAKRSTLLTGVALHGLVLSLASLVVGVAISAVLARVMPFGIRLEFSGVVKVGSIAIAIGLMASLIGYRRTVGIDPTVAFGR